MSKSKKKSSSKRGIQTKHWCFTINNPVLGDEPSPEDALKLFQYLVRGKEVGKNGTPHIQGYCVLYQRKRLTGMKKLYPRAHLEVMKGTPLEAATYCKKDGDFEEIGKLPLTAAETSSEMMAAKWDNAWELAKQGRIEDIPDASIRIRCYSALKRIQKDYPQPVADNEATCGIWIYGKSGSGKSYMARAMYSPFYDKPLNKWWDGYRHQDHVILDDVGLEKAKFLGYYLKRWADRYSFPAEQKNTTVQIRPKTIIVTSQHRIDELYTGCLLEAIQRRFREVFKSHATEKFREYFARSRGATQKITLLSESDELSDDSDSDLDF